MATDDILSLHTWLNAYFFHITQLWWIGDVPGRVAFTWVDVLTTHVNNHYLPLQWIQTSFPLLLWDETWTICNEQSINNVQMWQLHKCACPSVCVRMHLHTHVCAGPLVCVCACINENSHQNLCTSCIQMTMNVCYFT